MNAIAMAPISGSQSVSENIRGLFEIPENVVYLNCPNMAPQLRSVTASGVTAVRMKSTPWKFTASEWFAGAEELRTLAARVLGTDSDGVALVPAASYGIATAAATPMKPVFISSTPWS